MPILIKDYTWRQTNELVIVRIPLKNINPSNVDLFTSDFYIKVHFPPYLFEACLFDAISESSSKCSLSNGEVTFELVKLEKKEWPSLQKDVSKKDMIKIKEEAIIQAQKFAEKEALNKKAAKEQRHKDCVKNQIERDTAAQEVIKTNKTEEHNKALQDVLQWKSSETCDDKTLLSTVDKVMLEYNQKVKNIRKSERTIENSSKEKEQKMPSWLAAAAKPIKSPPVRKSGIVKMNFTFRAFPTPCRESQLNSEEEWLKKQAEARRLTGFVSEDLRPEEKDPDWLLNKGKSFHDVANYLGAVSAFTYAIKHWNKIPELYVARAESQVRLGNWNRVVQDTSQGLDLCRPHVAANEEMRFKCYYNRGLALIELGHPKSAMGELEEALEIRPYDEKLHHLIDRAENYQSLQKDKSEEYVTKVENLTV